MIKKAVIFLLFLINLSFAMDYTEIKEAYYRSYQYERNGDYERAIKALVFVYNEYPDGYTVNLRLGWLYYLMKKYSNALFHYQKAMKTIPSSIEAKLGYSLVLLAQEKYPEVEKVCYQIINTDYFNYYGNLRLAYALRMQKKYDIALKVVNKMLAVYPTDVNFLTYLGILKFLIGQKKEAREIFKNILILDPENTTAKEYLKK